MLLRSQPYMWRTHVATRLYTNNSGRNSYLNKMRFCHLPYILQYKSWIGFESEKFKSFYWHLEKSQSNSMTPTAMITISKYQRCAWQAGNELWTPGGAKSSLRGAQIFWTVSNHFKLVQHIFPGGEKFSRGVSPPLCPPWLWAWCMDWILDFLDPGSCCLQQDQMCGFLCCTRSRIGFEFAEKMLLVVYLAYFNRSQTGIEMFVSSW